MFCFVGAINIVLILMKNILISFKKFNKNNQIASTFSKIETKLKLKKTG